MATESIEERLRRLLGGYDQFEGEYDQFEIGEYHQEEEWHHGEEWHRLDKEVKKLQHQLQGTTDEKAKKHLQEELSITQAKMEIAVSKREKARALKEQRHWKQDGDLKLHYQKLAEGWENKLKKNEEHLMKLESEKKKKEQYEESHHLCEEALSHGYVVIKVVITVVVGPAGVGKTHLKFLLLEKKPPALRTSTPGAEAPVLIQVRTVSSEKFRKLGKKWQEVSADQMLPLIARYIRSMAVEKKEAIPEELKVYLEQLQTPTIDTTSQDVPSATPSDGTTLSECTTASSLESTPPNVEEDSACSLPDSEPASANEAATLKKMINSLMGKLEELVIEEGLSEEDAEKLFSREWIYFTDSGGQPQFHELLPLFVRDVSSVVIVSRLSDRLDQYPIDEYYKDGKLIGKCESTQLTCEDQMKCLIRSLLSRNSVDKLPKIIMVGTHLDKAGECSESVEQKDEKLIEMLGPEFNKQLVYYKPFTKVLFPLNALNPGEQDNTVADSIRTNIGSSVAKEAKVPIQWYILEHLIQGLAKSLGRRVLSKKLCSSIANALSITEKSLEAALHFFDELNVLKYSDALPEVVFVDSQVPLDKISELVHHSYLLKHGRVSTPLEGDWKRFCEQGVVTLDFLSFFPNHYVKGLFEAPELLELLKNQLVAMPLAKLDSSVESVHAVEHFMPALLDILSRKELEKHRVFSSAAAPLLFQFSHGCRRAGVFCCLAVHLMKHSNWSIQHKNGGLILVARNCITFRHPKHACYVTLIDAFYYIEAHIEATASVCLKACPIIREDIFTGIDAACKKLRYINDTPQLAVFCPHPSASPPPSTELRHAAVVEKEDNCCMCTKSKVFAELEDKHTIWLQEAKEDTECMQLTSASALSKIPQGNIRFSHFKVIKWNNEKGEVQRFFLMEKISHKWQDIGELLDIPHSKLKSISMKDRGDPSECCRAVLREWMDNPPPDYPTTWQGLIDLLEDSQLGQVVSELRNVLAKLYQ